MRDVLLVGKIVVLVFVPFQSICPYELDDDGSAGDEDMMHVSGLETLRSTPTMSFLLQWSRQMKSLRIRARSRQVDMPPLLGSMTVMMGVRLQHTSVIKL
ncbi:hypothetical protein C2S52_019341 [Perilla frutescens var. hirtella]|nr:hypothetical protein C2S52_019341 [Perilla frutescens var. hirtella]KAH6806374.1 hypothetical protein C2S51_031205 [Perilla frutescens var. frutescens]